MAKTRTTAICGRCGFRSTRWVGRCPSCEGWGTLEEVALAPVSATANGSVPPVPLAGVDLAGARKRSTGIGELDRVLGGGLVRGGAYLIAGEPGIGKSTLLLQVARAAAAAGERVLLVCGEETPEQVRARAERLGGVPAELWATRATDAATVEAAIDSAAAGVVIVDSIQAIARADLPGLPGSVGQVRSSADALARAAKDRGVTLLLVGQATKDGQVAGPRALEHLVDVVLWFEGDAEGSLRLLRATKNRFGPATEVGCFTMTAEGLREVSDPSRLLVAERAAAVPGVCVVPLLEGNRSMLVEVQALVGPTSVPAPRRTGAGLDGQRLGLLVAVLERRAGVRLGAHDVFAATMGGVRASEPAADLAIALAVASSFLDAPLPAATVAVGEVGLSGEVRAAADVARRLDEAARLGFARAIVPASENLPRAPAVPLLPVRDVSDALGYLERNAHTGTRPHVARRAHAAREGSPS